MATGEQRRTWRYSILSRRTDDISSFAGDFGGSLTRSCLKHEKPNLCPISTLRVGPSKPRERKAMLLGKAGHMPRLIRPSERWESEGPCGGMTAPPTLTAI